MVFIPVARAELIDAQTWYEAECAGLGRRFRVAVDSAAQRMAFAPRQFPMRFKNLRRAGVKKFPYALFFYIADDALFVVACFHSSRDPLQWKMRH